ncbi:MAG: hypothetical protein ACK4GL_12595 [Flavobacteriales bacterium]
MDKIYKWLFILNLCIGIILLFTGIYIYIEGAFVSEEELNYTLETNFHKLNGVSTIFLGLIILLFSRKTYSMYRSEVKYVISTKKRKGIN